MNFQKSYFIGSIARIQTLVQIFNFGVYAVWWWSSHSVTLLFFIYKIKFLFIFLFSLQISNLLLPKRFSFHVKHFIAIRSFVCVLSLLLFITKLHKFFMCFFFCFLLIHKNILATETINSTNDLLQFWSFIIKQITLEFGNKFFKFNKSAIVNIKTNKKLLTTAIAIAAADLVAIAVKHFVCY